MGSCKYCKDYEITMKNKVSVRMYVCDSKCSEQTTAFNTFSHKYNNKIKRQDKSVQKLIQENR